MKLAPIDSARESVRAASELNLEALHQFYCHLCVHVCWPGRTFRHFANDFENENTPIKRKVEGREGEIPPVRNEMMEVTSD
jgi:hypothetical protein